MNDTLPTNTDSQLLKRLLIWGVLLGILARLLRFLVFKDLWGDEAFMGMNIVDKSYSELLGPLGNRVVAPPMFLWLCKWCWEQTHVLWAMRIPALVAGVASVYVFYQLVKSALSQRQAHWALILFACSMPTITYCSELRHYALDLLFSCSLLAMTVQLLKPQSPTKQKLVYLGMGLIVAIGVWFSYVLVVIGVGIGVALSWMCLKNQLDGKRITHIIGLAIFATLSAASLIALYLLVMRHIQQGDSGQYMVKAWGEAFPPWDKPWLVPWWLIKTHTGKLLEYPAGDKNFASTGTTILCITGIVFLWKNSGKRLLTLLLMPLLILFTLASLKIYPYGGHVRIMLFLAPVFCTLAGIGISELILKTNPRHHNAFGILAATLLIAVAIASITQSMLDKQTQLNGNSIADLVDYVAHNARDNDMIVVFNDTNCYDGPGIKILFELHMKTKLGDRPLWHSAMAFDQLAPGQSLYAIAFEHDQYATPDALDTWKKQIDPTGKAHVTAMDITSIHKHDAHAWLWVYTKPQTPVTTSAQ